MNTDTTILDNPIPGPIEESSCATVDTGALLKWLLQKQSSIIVYRFSDPGKQTSVFHFHL
jgi:hypothetical protein